MARPLGPFAQNRGVRVDFVDNPHFRLQCGRTVCNMYASRDSAPRLAIGNRHVSHTGEKRK